MLSVIFVHKFPKLISVFPVVFSSFVQQKQARRPQFPPAARSVFKVFSQKCSNRPHGLFPNARKKPSQSPVSSTPGM